MKKHRIRTNPNEVLFLVYAASLYGISNTVNPLKRVSSHQKTTPWGGFLFGYTTFLLRKRGSIPIALLSEHLS